MYASGHNCNWRSPPRILSPLTHGLYDNHIDDPTKKLNWTFWTTHSPQAVIEIDINNDRYNYISWNNYHDRLPEPRFLEMDQITYPQCSIRV